MILETKYLTKAIQKAGYVVIVKTCYKNERKSTLEYISPNASGLGMNPELLIKGLKLTEDYIHPEDRKKVIPTILRAVEGRVSDYTHKYRMVGDDGIIYNISNEICVSDIDENTFKVEFYIKNIDENETYEEETSSEFIKQALATEAQIADGFNFSSNPDLSIKDKLYTVMTSFAKLSRLYSVFVDNEGKVVCPPVGPDTNLGDFYDLFEKPAYKEYYKQIKRVTLDNSASTILDREEGGIGKISAAPLKLGNRIVGFWILGSYTEEETKRLKNVNEFQYKIAELLSEFIHQDEVIATEVAKSKGAGAKLRAELERQNIINDALTRSGSKLIDNVYEVIEQTLKAAGINLNIDVAFLYSVKNKSNKHIRLKTFWDIMGDVPEDSIVNTLPDRLSVVEEEIAQNGGLFLVDNANITEKTKLAIMRYNLKAIVGVPIYMDTELHSIVFFGQKKSGRIWLADEIRFMKSVALVIQSMLEDAEGDDNVRKVNKHLVDTYNCFNVGVFVRDMTTGKVLFSNKKMNQLVGQDFTGKDSRTIITDLHDRFDNITGMRKPFITKDKITNWRSYIQTLDEIMDITEIRMEWLEGEPASLIILRPAKEF